MAYDTEIRIRFYDVIGIFGIVDIPDVCIWLIESGITDQTLQVVTLTVAVFDINQHSKTILKGEILHPGIL